MFAPSLAVLPARTLQRAARQRTLSILIYHRVLPERDPLRPGEVRAATFDWHMRLLARCFRPLPLSEGLRRLQDGSLPPGAVSVTFDDGYADNLSVALPILERWSVPATVFVATGYLDGSLMWNDVIIESLRRLQGRTLTLEGVGSERWELSSVEAAADAAAEIIGVAKYLPPEERARLCDQLRQRCGETLPRLMLSEGEARELAAAGVEIGSHTISHPILASLDEASAGREIVDSKRDLEALLQRPVSLFAYPNGKPGKDFDPIHTEMIRAAGYAYAVTTAWGTCRHDSDPHLLPRFTPWDRRPWTFAARLSLNALRGPG